MAGTVVAAIAIVTSGLDSDITSKTTEEAREHVESAKAQLEHDEIRLNCNGNGTGLPLPLGEGWGEGLRSFVGPAPPHPICCANRPLPAGERWTVRRTRRFNVIHSISSLNGHLTHLRIGNLTTTSSLRLSWRDRIVSDPDGYSGGA